MGIGRRNVKRVGSYAIVRRNAELDLLLVRGATSDIESYPEDVSGRFARNLNPVVVIPSEGTECGVTTDVVCRVENVCAA